MKLELIKLYKENTDFTKFVSTFNEKYSEVDFTKNEEEAE